MPLVNRYLRSPAEIASERCFPLQIARCPKCWLSQLNWVVDPALLYSDYAYHSSVSVTFQRHCREMAEALAFAYQLDSRSKVIEIASNDGCLQEAFHQIGIAVLGVEPAANLAASSRERGFRVLSAFWSDATVGMVMQELGPADLVIANNVVAHVDDLLGFLEAVRKVLSPGGVFVFEVPYLTTFLMRTEFDTTYHEHLSYFLLSPIQEALSRAGLELFDVQEFDIHGGSIRVHACCKGAGKVGPEVARMLRSERDFGFLDVDLYVRFTQHVEAVREELVLFLNALSQRGRSIAAYGASAKGNILLNYCGFGPDLISYIVDDTPAKQGLFAPGCGIPIVPRGHLEKEPPDYLLLLAWNFADELMSNVAWFAERGGRFVVPIPALRVV